MTSPAIEVARLTKRFGSINALDGLCAPATRRAASPRHRPLHGDGTTIVLTLQHAMPLELDFAALGVSCAALFVISVKIVNRRWVA